MKYINDHFLIEPVAEQLRKYTSISGVNDDDKVKAALIEAQDLDLPAVIDLEGTGIVSVDEYNLNVIYEEMTNQTLKDVFRSLLVRCLSHFTLARLIEGYSYTFTESGLYNDPNTVDHKTALSYVENQRRIANDYAIKLNAFITENLTDPDFENVNTTEPKASRFRVIGGTNSWDGNI